MSLDGGFIYIAGKCGLVPVLAENYSKWRGEPLSVLLLLDHGERRWENHSLTHIASAIKLWLTENLLPRLWAASSLIPTVILKDRSSLIPSARGNGGFAFGSSS